jgi:radical SAM superfamily enzyme YgiQ (UPF0313 family)
MEVFQKPITENKRSAPRQALGRYDIVPHISFVIGVPGNRRGSGCHARSGRQIYRANPKTNIFLFYFTPLPGVRLANSPQYAGDDA